jgi:uncharacterized membrane protein YkvI
MWSQFYAEGGWGMHPVTIFGLLLVASTVLCLLRPERRFVPIVACLGVATLGAGLLGTAVGFVTTFHYIQEVPPVDQFKIAAAGVAESLHNVVLSLILVVLSALPASLAALRAVRAAAPKPVTE